MKRTLLVILLAVACAGLGLWAGSRFAPQLHGLLHGVGEPTAPAETAPSAARQLYTCGMHPQVVQDHPGTCPICGMNLVPVKDGNGGGAAGGSQPKKERTIKYWVAPMDPTYIRDAPGKSPMGMDLVPVYAEEGEAV